jgi:thiosulfate reductase cytochrome b subunit
LRLWSRRDPRTRDGFAYFDWTSAGDGRSFGHPYSAQPTGSFPRISRYRVRSGLSYNESARLTKFIGTETTLAALFMTKQQTPEFSVRLYAKHGLLTRTLHWLNLVAISGLVATGIVVLRSPDPAPLANLPHELFIAGSIHLVFYFLLFAVGAAYLALLIVGGGWKMFVPTRATLRDAIGVVKSELRIGSHAPRLAKYNGAQRLAYAAVLLMVAFEVLTGLAMIYRKEIPWLGAAFGGRHAVHVIHEYLMFGIIAFVVVHVVEVIRAGWPSLRSMLSGYDIVSATTPVAIDGALPEPDLLCTPVSPSSAQKTVDVQTRKGFTVFGASVATGFVLLAFDIIRGKRVEDAARPGERSDVAAGEPPDDDNR